MTKKVLSVILTIVLMLSVFSILPMTVSAEEADLADTGYFDEKEENDSPSEANLMSYGETWRGAISFDWDADYYKVFADDYGKISFTIKVVNPVSKTNSTGLWVTLYGGDYSKIGMITLDGATKTTVELPFIGAKAGSYYYIGIDPGYGSPKGIIYDLSVNFTAGKYYEKESNNKENTATNLTFDHAYEGTIGGDYTNADGDNCYDQDYYHIKAPAKGTMKLTFHHTSRTGDYSDSGWYIEIYKKENGSQQMLNQGHIMLASADDTNLKAIAADKDEEFWFCVKSIADPSRQQGQQTYHPSDILGEVYSISGQFIQDEPPEDFTVSGTITSYLNNTDPITVQLLQSDSVKYFSTVKGENANYILSNVTKGIYTLCVSKKNHVTRDYTVNVSGNKTQDVKICPLGDADGNGKVQAADAMKAYQHAQGNTDVQLSGYAFQCADVAPVGNPNGKVQAADAMVIYQQAQGKHSLF